MEIPLSTSPRLIDLLEDYRTNVALYAAWQAAFRKHLPPTLLIWGKLDPVLMPPGTRADLDDLPQAKLVWLNAGHSVLDQNSAQVAAGIKSAFVPRVAAPAIELIARKRAACIYPSLTARWDEAGDRRRGGRHDLRLFGHSHHPGRPRAVLTSRWGRSPAAPLRRARAGAGAGGRATRR